MLGFTAPPRPMAIDTEGGDSPPDNVSAPMLSGSFFVGQTLTCSTGTWSGSPSAFEYKWQNEAVDNGDTDNQYTSVAGDDGDRLRCLVRAQNGAGWSDWVESNALYVIALLQWLDASDVSSITHTGGLVSSMADKSGNGRNATNAVGASMPVTGANTQNGLNVITYDGVNDILNMPTSMAASLVSGDTTQIHLMVPLTLPGTKSAYWGSGTGTRFGFEFTNNVGVRIFSGNTNYANISMGGTAPTGVGYIVAARRTGNSLVGYVNGSTYSGSVTNGNGGTLGTFRISDSFLHMNHAESIIVGRSLSNPELNQIGSYISSKWGVTWSTVS